MGIKTYIREQKSICGPAYMEVDFLRVTDQQHRASSRAKKKLASSIVQRERNNTHAKRYFAQLINTNFTEHGFHVTLTYEEEYLPGDDESAGNDLSNYIRRVQRYCRRKGWPAPRWVAVTEHRDPKKDGEEIRFHHHIVIECDLEDLPRQQFRTALEDLWKNSDGESYGFVNADALQPDKDNLEGLALYLTKYPANKRRWRQGKGLKKPEHLRPNDSRFTAGTLARACQQRIDDADYWEAKYPGYAFNGAVANFNQERAEWSLYIKMRKKKPAAKRNKRPLADKADAEKRLDEMRKKVCKEL